MFINGKSFHPLSVFKGIITGEAKRLRRLNIVDDNYKMSIKRLEEKCHKSNFNTTITSEKINLVKHWVNNDKNIMKPEITTKEEKLPWATQFKKYLKLDKLDKKLVPRLQLSIAGRQPWALNSSVTKISQMV